MKTKTLLGIAFTTLILLACVCTSSSDLTEAPPVDAEEEQPQIQASSTEELESTSIPTMTNTVEPTRTEQPTQTLGPSPTAEPLIDAFGILGKPVDEVESIFGQTGTIFPKNNDQHFAGGEYREYRVGKYFIVLTYDNLGIARVFLVLYGLSLEDYSVEDWSSVFPEFGVFLESPPDREAPMAVYWDNYDGYYVAFYASNISGAAVWNVEVSEAPYDP